MNRLGLAIVIAFLVASWVPLLGVGGVAAAADPQGTEIQVSSMPAKDKRGKAVKGQYWLMATLTTADGRYVADRRVQFVEPVDFFGGREAILGMVATDGTGLAAVIYQPSQPGQHTIVARFGGDRQYAPSKAELAVEVDQAVPPFAEEPSPLAAVGNGLAIFLAILGLAFWAVLLGILGYTIRRIKQAPDAEPARAAAGGSRGQEVPI
jgi:hypothetical protein